MKANELMIGDWICSSINDINVRIAPADLNWDNAHTEWLANSKPIPLTAEILEKNGWNVPQAKLWWECFNVGFWLRQYVDGRFEIMTDEDSDCIFTTIRYVHELQHALRLCGIDKEIVL